MSSPLAPVFSISETAIGRISDAYVQRYWELSPMAATAAGIDGYDHLLDDLSPAGEIAELELLEEFLPQIRNAVVHTQAESIAQSVMLHDLETELTELHAKSHGHAWGVVTSVVSSLSDTYSLMDVAVSREALLARAGAVGTYLDGWFESVMLDAEDGIVNSQHSTAEEITQFKTMSARGMHQALLEDATPEERAVLTRADDALAEMADRIAEQYLPLCRKELGVGRAVYETLASSYLGAEVDLTAAYERAIGELADVNAEMRELALSLYPDADHASVPALLDEDPRYCMPNAEALKARIEEMFQTARVALAADFHIPSEISRCDVVMDDNAMDASPYYQGPSEDLSRAGAMCYPVANRETFPLWREVSTVYHESIPGHHLQIGISLLERENLTSFQRLLSWNCGYGEGWALYAERVMDMLGFLQDPADRLGYLICRALRIARVVIDIGLHMDLPAPHGTEWSYENTVEYLIESAWLTRAGAESEINRYIAWPGQAITYKIGEEYWLAARTRAEQAGVPLVEFHERLLRSGSMPLAMLEELSVSI
jgi:uncharacterized protein (DUF885 family)